MAFPLSWIIFGPGYCALLKKWPTSFIILVPTGSLMVDCFWVNIIFKMKVLLRRVDFAVMKPAWKQGSVPEKDFETTLLLLRNVCTIYLFQPDMTVDSQQCNCFSAAIVPIQFMQLFILPFNFKISQTSIQMINWITDLIN